MSSTARGLAFTLAFALLSSPVGAQEPSAEPPATPPVPSTPPEVPPVSPPAPPPSPPPRRGSGPPVWVNLKNGTSIQGRMIESQPGQLAVIETEDGWELTIGWDRIASIGSEAPKATSAPATGAAPTPEGPAPKRAYSERGGVRLGLGFPTGSVEDGDQAELSRGLGTSFELEANLGLQVSAFYVGLYAGYALGSPGSDFAGVCDSYDCSVYGLRLGANFTVHLSPQAKDSAWLGYGVGWSADEIDISMPEGKRQMALGGVDFLRLSGGYDFGLNDNFTVGPFAAFNGGMYLYSVKALDGVGDADDVDSPKLKGFFVLGARMMVNP